MTDGRDQHVRGRRGAPEHDPAHAPGKRRKGQAGPKRTGASRRQVDNRAQYQPWIPTSGLVGRKRRSPHQ